MTYLVKGLPIIATGRMGQISSIGSFGKDGIMFALSTDQACVNTSNPTKAASNGFTFDSNGSLRVFQSSAGLPNPTRYCNGLPFDASGALCTDAVNPIAYTASGIPFTTVGAVAAT